MGQSRPSWNGDAHGTIVNCPREKGTFILDTDASDVSKSATLHRQQEVDSKLRVRPIANCSKMVNSTERKYGAPKAELLTAVGFIEKFRSHIDCREVVLRVDKIEEKWLKNYSMTSDIVSRWITILDAFKVRIEHWLRDKNFSADRLSKKTEFCESREEHNKNRPDVTPGFVFLDQEYYDLLRTVLGQKKTGGRAHPTWR